MKNISSEIIESKNIYCADGGADYLKSYGIIPKIIMGDMDSISIDTRRFYEDAGCEFEIFPCEKDETDGELIINRALMDKPEKIVVLCGTGGRIDHFLGNIQLMYRVAKKDISVEMVSDDSRIIMSSSEIHVKKREGEMVSVIPYSENTVLTLSGFRYNVEKFRFEKDKPIGISNYVTDDLGIIKVHSGYPIVVVTSNI